MARELGRPVTVDEVRPYAVAALEESSGSPSRSSRPRRAGLWAQPVHEKERRCQVADGPAARSG